MSQRLELQIRTCPYSQGSSAALFPLIRGMEEFNLMQRHLIPAFIPCLRLEMPGMRNSIKSRGRERGEKENQRGSWVYSWMFHVKENQEFLNGNWLPLDLNLPVLIQQPGGNMKIPGNQKEQKSEKHRGDKWEGSGAGSNSVIFSQHLLGLVE